MSRLKHDSRGSNTTSGLKRDVAALKQDVAEIKHDVSGLQGEVAEIKQGMEHLTAR